MASTVDAHATIEQLMTAGLERPAAEAITAVIAGSDSKAGSDSTLVTKTCLKAEIAALEKRLMLYGLGVAGLLFAALGLTGTS